MSKSKEEIFQDIKSGHLNFIMGMEQYAKNRCIEFNKWREERADLAIKKGEKLFMPKSISELYDLFIQHQSQQP